MCINLLHNRNTECWRCEQASWWTLNNIKSNCTYNTNVQDIRYKIQGMASQLFHSFIIQHYWTMFHKLRLPKFNHSTPKLKLLDRRHLKCVFTRKRKLLSRLIECLQRIDNISSKIVSITMSTHSHRALNICEYIFMSQLALQHPAEADINFLYFSL